MGKKAAVNVFQFKDRSVLPATELRVDPALQRTVYRRSPGI